MTNNAKIVQKGDVVQLDPAVGGFFPACLMVVTEVKSWGVQGYIPIPQKRDESPRLAYFRVKHELYAIVGKAEWTAQDEDEEEEDL